MESLEVGLPVLSLALALRLVRDVLGLVSTFLAHLTHKLVSPRRCAPEAHQREGYSRQLPLSFYLTSILVAARGRFRSLRRTLHYQASAESSCVGTNPPGETIPLSEFSRWRNLFFESEGCLT